MKKEYIISVMALTLFFFAACGGGNKQNNGSSKDTGSTTSASESENPSYDPHRGEGKFTDFTPGPFSADLAAKGKSIYNTKCQSCHKLTDEKLVGPGWKDVTEKHSAGWILNFLTNTDEMLDKDPELQKQLEICMVRMPNQNLTDGDAKAVYNFMRENDNNK